MKKSFLFLTLVASVISNIAFARSAAVESKTQFLEKDERKIAYRSIGKGQPIILGLRFRGILDSWDPAFLDALAKDFRVIIFDWSGLGRSTGERATSMKDMVKDFTDLAEGLKLKNPIIAGWSMGGMVAQETLATHPGIFTHGILIGTTPACSKCGTPSQDFLTAAAKPVNDLKDEEILFFYPPSPTSMKAAKASHDRIAQRTKDLSVAILPEYFAGQSKAVAGYREDKSGVMDMHMKGKTPILVISGDHDNALKVEDWYQFSGKMPNTFLVVFPDTGHGPQHQHPELSAKYIKDFVQTIKPLESMKSQKISEL